MRKIAYGAVGLFVLIIVLWLFSIWFTAAVLSDYETSWKLIFSGGPFIIAFGVGLIIITILIYFLRSNKKRRK